MSEIEASFNDDLSDVKDEYNVPHCLVCGSEFEWEPCWNGCDEGFFDGYDEDPLWYSPGDLVRCGECNGRGGYLVCPNAENHVRKESKDDRP